MHRERPLHFHLELRNEIRLHRMHAVQLPALLLLPEQETHEQRRRPSAPAVQEEPNEQRGEVARGHFQRPIGDGIRRRSVEKGHLFEEIGKWPELPSLRSGVDLGLLCHRRVQEGQSFEVHESFLQAKLHYAEMGGERTAEDRDLRLGERRERSGTYLRLFHARVSSQR